MAKKDIQRVTDNVTIEGARLMFKNFSGEEGRYNATGKRNFCVIIPDDQLADRLAHDGWNVKMLRARNEDEADRPYLKVNVHFGGPRPPKVVMITSSGRTVLTEETIGSLDFADILNVDLIIRPYNWEGINGSGVAAYLKTMYVTIDEDDLEKKYHIPRDLSDDFEEDLPFDA